MGAIEVTTYYLAMQSPEELNAKINTYGLVIQEAQIKQYQLNRFMYELVGASYHWKDKLVWSAEQWTDYAERPDLRTWVAYKDGSPAGYFELFRDAEDTIDIAHFGLAPKFVGMGHGGPLLTAAIRSAWQWSGCRRLTVNTCTLDHPHALKNYQARGFKIYETQRK